MLPVAVVETMVEGGVGAAPSPPAGTIQIGVGFWQTTWQFLLISWHPGVQPPNVPYWAQFLIFERISLELGLLT